MTKMHIETPLIKSLGLSRQLDACVWLKMDALQPCGSFKARGIGYACTKYKNGGATALITSSGGNAGLAVAYAGRQLHLPVTVVVPVTAKKRAIQMIEQEGAKVIVKGANWDEAHAYTVELSSTAARYIHPFDDPYIWQGHASIMDEIYHAGITPDAIVLSVGGGGLLCGVVEGLCRNNGQKIPVLAVETAGADSLHAAFLAKENCGIDDISSIATSLGAKKVAQRAFDLLNEYPVTCHKVSDSEAVDACYHFLDDHRVLVEPACGASLASVYQPCDFFQNKKSIVVIVCGGVGVTLKQLAEWKKVLG